LIHRPDLDGLRGVAILFVIVAHLVGVDRGPLAMTGVTVFFVLSGFLITRLLVAERERTGRVSFGRFYLRRVARLAPAFGTLLVFIAIVCTLGIVRDERWPLQVGIALTYLGNWPIALEPRPIVDLGPVAHTWSLSIEEQFYAVWPIVLGLSGRRALPIAVIGAVVGSALFALGGTFAYFGTVTNMGSILIGSSLALRRLELPAWAGPAGAGVIAIGCAMAAAPVVALGAAAVIAARWTPLRRLGAIGRRAYSLYIWNWPLLLLLGPIPSLPALFLVAEISYRFVERPIIRAAHLVTSRPAGAMPAAVPVQDGPAHILRRGKST